MMTMLNKEIKKTFVVPHVQTYADNKALMTVQGIMERGVDTFSAPDGFIVGAHKGRPIFLDVEAHLTTLGKTGSGKGVSTVIPNLLSHTGSVVSLEIGGATFKNTYNYRKHKLGQDIYIFDPQNVVGMGCSNYNPMDDLDPNDDDFYTSVLTLASALTADAEGHKEQNPYFRENPHGLLTAMIIYLKMADASVISDEQKNFVHLARIFSQFPTEAWHKHIKALKEWNGPHSILLNGFGTYLGTAQDGDQNARSVVSATAQWLLKWTADKALGKHIVSSDFSMKDLRDKKTTVYVVMKTVNDYITYQPWLRLILQSAIDNTPNKGDGGKDFKHEDRILFMIDELTQLGHLQVIANGAQTVRQKGIVFWSSFQDYSGLVKVYGEEGASSFIGASDLVQVYRTKENRSLEYISKQLGSYMVYMPAVSDGQGIQISSGAQKSQTNGTAHQITWQNTKTIGVTLTTQETKSKAITLGNFWNRGRATAASNTYSSGLHGTDTTGSTTTMSDGSGNSTATTDADSITKGEASQEMDATASGGSSGENTASLEGTNEGESYNENYNVSFQPSIIDALDFREIKKLLAGQKQILFTDSNAGSYCTLDDQARYYEIPYLKDRAEGPPPPKAPCFPKPPEKLVVRLTPMSSINKEDFNLGDSKLSWRSKNLVTWKAPSDLSEWGQGVKETCERYQDALHRLSEFDEKPGFFNGLFRNNYVLGVTGVAAAATSYIGGRIMAAGITFGAVMATGKLRDIWQRNKLVHEKFVCLKDYRDMRCAAIKMVWDQLNPVMESHDTNKEYMLEVVQRQHELVAGNGKMGAVMANSHEALTERLEEHRANLETSRELLGDIRRRVVSGWSSGDWGRYIKKLDDYKLVREKFFDFDKGDYLPQPSLVTPLELGSPPLRTLTSRTAPMPEMFEVEALVPVVARELAVLPKKGIEARENLEAYLNTPLIGYDLPDGIKTAGDAVNRCVELAASTKKCDLKDVMLMNAALDSMEDPLLEKFDGLVRGYVSGLREDENSYHTSLCQKLVFSQDDVKDTFDKIKMFNLQVTRLNGAQRRFEGFARRLDEARETAHHMAHVRAMRGMDEMKCSFDAQSERLRIRGPLVPKKQPKKRQELKHAQPSK